VQRSANIVQRCCGETVGCLYGLHHLMYQARSQQPPALLYNKCASSSRAGRLTLVLMVMYWGSEAEVVTELANPLAEATETVNSTTRSHVLINRAVVDAELFSLVSKYP